MNEFPVGKLVAEGAHFFPECSYWILNMVNDPLVLLDDSGMILFMNEKACDFYGYSLEEIQYLHIMQLDLNVTVSEKYLYTIQYSGQEGHIFLSTHRKKNHELVQVQIDARHVKVHDKSIFALLIKNISLERRLKREFEFASRIQKNMLPQNYKNSQVEIRSMYRPYHYVSGDFFNFRWEENNVLNGYVLDIMGHGLTTSFMLSALRVLLAQAFKREAALNDKLAWFNQQAIPFLTEDSFAALICFSLDFEKRELTYSMAGINHFLAIINQQPAVIKKPGLFIGIDKKAEYECHKISFGSGDVFYFMTDGLFELLKEPAIHCPIGYSDSYRWLFRTTRSRKRRDDIAALCLHIK
ncbi:SpoIIE family protein phosphatase [Anaerosinus massiliensis]|uniref:SpoIIE family protein phosphatase n=1 Tax=Massilibacillus massiliensis TaxID=1806837 RepID=UPI000DA60F54|nr:SpoIIE family protein phosphatase [Massilibacillus massiliensis]